MKLNELETKRAQNLASALAAISPKSQITGYLVGLMQDVKRCVEVNLKNDADNDSGDESVIAEIIESLTEAETSISALMSTAIQRGKKE